MNDPKIETAVVTGWAQKGREPMQTIPTPSAPANPGNAGSTPSVPTNGQK